MAADEVSKTNLSSWKRIHGVISDGIHWAILEDMYSKNTEKPLYKLMEGIS